MNKYSPEELLNIWKRGKPLNDAIWQFCDPKYKNEYQDINLNQNTSPNNLAENFLKILDYNSKKNDAGKQLWNNLFQKIIRGNLIALGYKNPIESDFPILIPAHMWPPENTDSNKSSISAHEIKYVRVRIIKKSALDIFQEIPAKNKKQLPEYKIQKKKTGRPSIGDEIIEAYHTLDKDGQVDIKLPLSSHYGAIRDIVSRSRPDLGDDKGMKDEAIRKRVAEFFNAKKKSHKPSHKL